ncbi:MAG TPA: modification methylase [Terriglobia bacterium]|nr:modification methylase [Terriglobia bacterium]
MDGKNKLYFGDNLKILRDHVADASVDLIYLDPPFNSNASYNVLFKEKSGEESAAQITALRIPGSRVGSLKLFTGKSSRAGRASSLT